MARHQAACVLAGRFDLLRLIAVSMVTLLVLACGRDEAGEGPASDRIRSSSESAGSAGRIPSTPALFRAVEQDTGLTFQHVSGATGRYRIPEILGSGVALIDYDKDGDLDVYFVQSSDLFAVADGAAARFSRPDDQAPGHRLFENRLVPTGRLAFVDVTEASGLADVSYGMGVAAADYDNDGNVDLYVTNVGPNALYRNDGGKFIRMPDAAGASDDRWGTSASFCDVNGDNRLDVYVANYVRYTVDDQTECLDATGRRDYCGPQAFKGVTDALFVNRGDGRFDNRSRDWGVETVSLKGLGVVCRDLNGDGTADVYVANDSEPNLLWINRDHARFEELGQLLGAAINVSGMSEGSMGIAAGDYDVDGDDDLFVTHWNNETNTLYRNDLELGFLDVTSLANLATPSLSHTGFGTEWIDIDNDGDLDVFIANGAVQRYADASGQLSDNYGQKNQVFMNDGQGRFVDAGTLAGDATALRLTGRGAAFGDIDNDGDTDLVVSNKDGPAKLFLNQVGQNNAWLGLKLQGTASGTDALGAVVHLTLSSGAVMRRVVRSDGSYMSASDTRVLFGLGDDATAKSVLVLWPSGTRQEFVDLAPNAYHTLVESP